MESTSLWSRVRDEGKSFFNTVRKSNETLYLILLTFYVMIYLMLKVTWTERIAYPMEYIRYGLLSIVMWGSALYLFFIIAEWKGLWKKTFWLVLICAVLLALTYWFSKYMSTNAYGVVMDVILCLLACGKSYKKMLKCVMWTTIGMLIIAGFGMIAGLTIDVVKPQNVSPGHSLGINYPNTWGYITFLAMMSAWYLYMRHKPLITFPFFWGMTAFMYLYISCRTIAVLTAVFPVLALVVDWLERRARQKQSGHIRLNLVIGGMEKIQSDRIGVIGWIVVAMPFIAFAFMLFASMQVEWVHRYLYPTFFYTFAMRFVQGGLYFRTYGLPIFGNPYRSNVHTYVNVNGTFEEVGILDSSFAAYIIMRGLFWLAYTLAWLSFAIWKALKRRDYAIPFLCGILLVFAMMERPGLDMWYNFILLYPLAKVAGDVLDRPQPAEAPAMPDGMAAEETAMPDEPAGEPAEGEKSEAEAPAEAEDATQREE